MGLDASGRVQYHSAFVSKIRSVGFGGEIGSVGQNKVSQLLTSSINSNIDLKETFCI